MTAVNPKIVALAFGLAAALVVWLYFRHAHTTKMSRCGNRVERRIDDLYAEYFSDQGISQESFTETWTELSRVLELTPGRLLPTDRFDKELAPPAGFEFNDPIKDVRYLIDKHSRRPGVKSGSIQTVGDYILAFAKK